VQGLPAEVGAASLAFHTTRLTVISEPAANQSPPFEGRNLFSGDRVLQAAVAAHGAAWANDRLTAWGETLGASSTLQLAVRANRFGPVLMTHNRYGDRIDEVEFDPAWHALMEMATREGEHCEPWAQPRSGAQLARAAGYLMHGEVENGSQCPLTMSFASVPLLVRHGNAHPWIAQTWLPLILARQYDPRTLPIQEKKAALIGMGMTERQGGSDVRANTTRAEPAADGSYRLTGHKWFFSVPTSDAHIVLAQTAAGVSCFLVPRILEGGEHNRVLIQRLKDKLGNRSNASSEVEFAGASGWLLGEEGRGVPVIIEMVQHTRLDCAIGSAGIVRGAVAQALHHAAHRRAFGKRLAEHPLMQNVLCDLALEAEGAIWLALRLAAAFENDASPADRALARIATPAVKFWLCKRAPMVVAEAMEVLGGNGYVEESVLPRLYREAPLNSIWEGAGNVMCLDVLRAAQRDASCIDALAAELALARGGDARLDAHAEALVAMLRDAPDEHQGRRIAGEIARALAAAQIVRHAPPLVADAYCGSRFSDAYEGSLGMLQQPVDADACRLIIERASIQ